MEMLNQKQKIILIIVIAVVAIVIGYYYIQSTKEVYQDTGNAENFIEEEEEGEEKTEAKVKVHITGAVNKSGVIELNEGDRIDDAIEKAGGITDDADLSNVNLAYMVEDGQKIYIPSVDDKVKDNENIVMMGTGNTITSVTTQSTTVKININTASSELLTSIPGVGESTATKIIEYRKANGKFNSIEDIKKVSRNRRRKI